jgi:hypothetical protein
MEFLISSFHQSAGVSNDGDFIRGFGNQNFVFLVSTCTLNVPAISSSEQNYVKSSLCHELNDTFEKACNRPKYGGQRLQYLVSASEN